ncbi:MAG TPA: YhcN/YlaJ family sporulation lipoprotein [Pseudobacteroides sp.]|uniref:YhcN/YlaJ family sporulation lipoprotein n=1 Tax=Pseudobacteroides sp. TaxID=1968840 RepID=UPI002F92445A
MKRRFPVILSVLLGVGLLTVLLAGGNILRRGNNGTNRNYTTQQGRNLSGTSMNGPSPIAGPNARNMAGTNADRGLNKTSPDIMKMGAKDINNNTNTNNSTNNNASNNNNTDNINNIRKGITFDRNNINNNNNNAHNNNFGTDTARLNTTAQHTGFNSKKADNICTQLDKINGIDNVKAAVSGNTALVGYDAANNNSDIGATKKLISDRVKQMDGTITNVVITDSKDISTRIGNLADNIKNKKPITQLDDEFNRIMQSINPAGNVFTR